MGWFICLFALVWGGFPVAALIGGADHDEGAVWIAGFFPLIALGLFLYGVFLIRHSKTITIGPDRIGVDEQRLFKRLVWDEPFSAYRGVLARTKRVSRGSKHGSSSYTVYLVELHHPDKDKTITLFSSTDRGSWRGRWERAARALGVPAIEESADGLVERDIQDLDKSVSELLEEGKLKIDYDSLGQKAEGVAVEVEGDELVVTRQGPQNSPATMIFFLAFPWIFIGVAYFSGSGADRTGAWLAGGFGVLFEVILICVVLWDLLSRERLRIGPYDLTTCSISRWGESKGRSLSVSAVETIKVGGPEGGARNTKLQPALVMVADRGKLAFGKRLPRETLDFLRNLILAKIEKSAQ